MEMGMKTLTLEETLYFGFFFLLSIAKGLGFYEGQKIFILLIIPAFLCALFKIFYSSYTKRQWIMQVILLLLTALVYYESREIGIFFIMFMILGMKNISVSKVMRMGLWIWSLCAVILSIISFFRLEHTVYRVAPKLGLGYIFRWSLGFTHPNILHITYLMLCALIIYELADRYCFKYFALLMMGNALVFFYSVSYTGFGIVTALLAGELYVKIRPKFCLLEKAVINMLLPVVLVFSFILPWLFLNFPSAALQKLNTLVNTRIKIASNYLVPECISLFGVKTSYLAQIQYYLSIDSSYIWAFIHYGMIPFALLMIAYLVLIADFSRKQKTRELVMIICFLGAGLTEPLLFNTSFKNITLLFVGELLFRQRAEEEEYCLIPKRKKKAERLFSEFLAKIRNKKCFQCKSYLWSGQIWQSCRKQIMAGILAGAVLGAALCGVLRTEPKGYVIPRKYADWEDKSSVYPESAEDPAYEGYHIMNYMDADTPMQVLEGNAVRLETARYYVGSVLLGGLCGYLFCIGCLTISDRNCRKRKMQNQV